MSTRTQLEAHIYVCTQFSKMISNIAAVIFKSPKQRLETYCFCSFLIIIIIIIIVLVILLSFRAP